MKRSRFTEKQIIAALREQGAGPPRSAASMGSADPADHPTIVHPRLASRVPRQMRLDLRKLIVRQPKKSRFISASFRKP